MTCCSNLPVAPTHPCNWHTMQTWYHVTKARSQLPPVTLAAALVPPAPPYPPVPRSLPPHSPHPDRVEHTPRLHRTHSHSGLCSKLTSSERPSPPAPPNGPSAPLLPHPWPRYLLPLMIHLLALIPALHPVMRFIHSLMRCGPPLDGQLQGAQKEGTCSQRAVGRRRARS